MITTFLAMLIAYPLLIIIFGFMGYFFGVLISWVPLINELLTKGIGLSETAVPTILAWVFIAIGIIIATRTAEE